MIHFNSCVALCSYKAVQVSVVGVYTENHVTTTLPSRSYRLSDPATISSRCPTRCGTGVRYA